MESYKIRVNNEDKSKEAQELFVQLGYELDLFFGKYESDTKWVLAFADGSMGCASEALAKDTLKEITLTQLRDIVVLKRNDVKDATHRDKRDESIYLTSDKVIYYWQGEWCKSAINKSNDYENYIANSLTPITQPQAPALISGAEAKLAWANGVDIQIKNVNCVNWYDLDESKYNLDIFDNVRVDFRLKPQNIKLELVLPKPFEPKDGEKYYFIHLDNDNGYGFNYFESKEVDSCWMQCGAYKTEEEIKQVVEQLRKIKGAV